MTHKIGQNTLILSLKFIIVDLLVDFLYWPIWWYSKGLVKTSQFAIHQIILEEKRIGLLLWIKNIFKPMYGQYDWQGRIISFFMRIIMIIGKLIQVAIWTLIMMIFFVVYLIAPVASGYQIVLYFL